jgi:hypothetical protein
MNRYSDITDIDTRLSVRVDISPVGLPNCWIRVNHDLIGYTALSDNIILDYQVGLLDNIVISVELYNKDYNADEAAVIINNITVDNINIIPQYSYLATYINDHDNNNPTNYLGFNGKWTLTIDQPFYLWLHRVQNQGWLIG